jgi:hypothetical protein
VRVNSSLHGIVLLHLLEQCKLSLGACLVLSQILLEFEFWHRPDILVLRARLCCTKRVRDSCRESNVVAGPHEQTDIADLQNQELG